MNTTNSNTNANTNANTNSKEQSGFFDVKTGGLGYLNRIREVQPKGGRKADPFWALTIALLNGDASDVNYIYIDCIVRGSKVKEIIPSLKEMVDQAPNDSKPKIFANCLIGDIWADPYMDKNGKPAAQLKGRLLHLENIKVDGKLLTVNEEASLSDDSLKTLMGSIGENDPLWPVAASYRLNPNDADFQTKLATLVSEGYEYDPTNFICRIVPNSEQDVARKARLQELIARSADGANQQQAVNS